MNILRNIWNWANGKKTVIGTVVFFLAVMAQRNGLVNAVLLGQIDTDVQNVASILALLGIGHKIVKWLEKPATVPPTVGGTV